MGHRLYSFIISMVKTTTSHSDTHYYKSQAQDLKMSSDGELFHYKNTMQLKADSTNEELREIYSKWSHNFDNVCA